LGLNDADTGLLTIGELASRVNCWLIINGRAEEDIPKTEDEMFPIDGFV
jgi:hypothetical protein